MALILLIIDFLLIFGVLFLRSNNFSKTVNYSLSQEKPGNDFNLESKQNPPLEILEIYIKSLIIFSTILVLITEVSSLFECFNYSCIALSWTLLSILLTIVLFNKRKIILEMEISREIIITHKFYLFCIVLILVLVFFQGIIYPPNNYDSMTYHLARITHWISQGSVSHFPTHTLRQIIQPPFSEFFISHINILSGNDILSNSVQLLFLISSIFSLILLSKHLGLNSEQKWIMVILAVTIPEVILQASSTQNDIVVSFFVITAIYFAIISLNYFSIENVCFLGLTVGLGLLSKGTSYIFLLPVVLFWCIFSLKKLIIEKNNKNALIIYIIGIISCILLNTGYYLRNYSLTGSILGYPPSEINFIINEKRTIPGIISNVSRNIAIHYTFPYINNFAEKVTVEIHKIIGNDISDPKTTFNKSSFTVSMLLGNFEDTAGNIIHINLIILSLLFLFVFRKTYDKKLLYMGIYIITIFVLFSGYLKWQPWITRLQTPFFLLSVPITASLATKPKLKHINVVMLFLLLTYSFVIILFNYSRPFITKTPFTSNIKITDMRYKKYFSTYNFAGSDRYYNDYLNIYLKIGKECKKSGVLFHDDQIEYPLFKDIFSSEIYTMPIYVQNISKKIQVKECDLDCIIFLDFIIGNIYPPAIKYNYNIYVKETLYPEGLLLYRKKN